MLAVAVGVLIRAFRRRLGISVVGIHNALYQRMTHNVLRTEMREAHALVLRNTLMT